MKLHPSGDRMGNIMKDIRDIYIPMAAERNLGFTINCELSDLQVFTDISKLKQILNNLLSNAFKFTREGSVTLTVEKDGENILFHVLDTGIGIPEDKREAIFHRFMQVEVEISRQYGGTGLGLSISLELAKLLQGSLQLLPQEENRKGSHFLLSVPRIIRK
jgi:signal transduction histidine kinase